MYSQVGLSRGRHTEILVKRVDFEDKISQPTTFSLVTSTFENVAGLPRLRRTNRTICRRRAQLLFFIFPACAPSPASLFTESRLTFMGLRPSSHVCQPPVIRLAGFAGKYRLIYLVGPPPDGSSFSRAWQETDTVDLKPHRLRLDRNPKNKPPSPLCDRPKERF